MIDEQFFLEIDREPTQTSEITANAFASMSAAMSKDS